VNKKRTNRGKRQAKGKSNLNSSDAE